MALATLDDVKNFYGITGDKDEDNNLIKALIDRFTSIFESYCNRTSFETATYTDYLDSDGGYYIFPKQSPITSVSGIWDDTGWVWSGNALDSTTYRIVNDNSIISSTPFTRGKNNIKIVYTAGYTSIPGDLKQVLIEEVIRSFKNRKSLDVVAVTASDGSVSRLAKDLLPTTIMVLNKYKRKYVV